jgi:hypothetical protein
MKIDQIAIATDDPINSMIKLSIALGLNPGSWVQDTVEATANVFGVAGTNTAQLNFNYDLNFELEVLRYEKGDNWHQRRIEQGAVFPFLSHLGAHCTEDECQEHILRMERIGVGIAQEVWTKSHTNPVIAGKRLYHYVVFDSLAKFGFDLKLIVRRDV